MLKICGFSSATEVRTCDRSGRHLLLWWASVSVPGTSSTSSAPSSWWSSASSSSTVGWLCAVRVVVRLVRCCARCHGRHSSRTIVVRLRRFSTVLLLHAGDQGSYFGHIRVHGRVVSGSRVAAGTSRAGFGTGGGDAERIDRLRMLEYYVTAYVFAHTMPRW